jgi:hypothetical protein
VAEEGELNLSSIKGFDPPARLPRDVPEKAETFVRWALCTASDELLIQ